MWRTNSTWKSSRHHSNQEPFCEACSTIHIIVTAIIGCTEKTVANVQFESKMSKHLYGLWLQRVIMANLILFKKKKINRANVLWGRTLDLQLHRVTFTDAQEQSKWPLLLEYNQHSHYDAMLQRTWWLLCSLRLLLCSYIDWKHVGK